MVRPVLLAVAAILACSVPPAWSKPLEVLPDGSVALRIDARHRMTLDGTPTPGQALLTALSRVTGGDHERVIVVQADANVRFGEVDVLLRRLSDAGYKRVMLRQPDTKGAARP